MEMESKKFYESKTFWFNLLAGLVAVASLFGFGDYVPSENATEIIALILTIVNLALRFATAQPIER